MADLVQIDINVRSNADQASRSLDRLQGSVVNNLKTVERLERNYKLLDKAFNTGKITAQRYAQGVAQVDRAIDEVMRGTKQATAATNQFSNSLGRATDNMNQYGKVSALGGKNLNRTNMVIQQAGYQFQDFAVQVQGGTNAFVALGQQGSQLLGLFGAKGAVLGAILAIGTAFANVSTSGKQLAFDFKQFGRDMASAFSPLMPVFSAIGTAFKYVANLAIDAINFIINGIAKLVTAFTYLPSIISEVFDRGWTYMQIFGNNVAILVNEIKFNFTMGLSAIAQDFAKFASSTAETLNGLFNLNLPTDIGSGMVDSLNESLGTLNDNYGILVTNNDKLKASVGGPIKSFEELQAALEGVQDIDIRNYFKLVAKATKDAGKEAKKLRDELEGPLVSAVESVSNAFGDFIARGLTDFKGFVKSILGSFQNMISQMIAMAVKNRIMLSLGIGGVTPAAAAAGQVAGLGTASTMLGSIGTGAGFAGIAGGTGFLGGAANTLAGLGGGGAGFFSIGANAAAAGGGFMATVGAALPVIAAAALVFAFFKKKVTELDNGLQGTITTLDATIESFRTLKTTRFFGLSKKITTETQALDQEAAGPLIESIQNIQKGVMDAAGAFGIASDVFDNFFYDFKVSLKGLSEEQKIQAVNEELAKMGDAFAALTGHFETMNELLEAANQRMELQNRLDQLLGNNAAILARQREAELAAMHKVNRPLAQAIYNLEDAQTAVQNAFASLGASIEAEKNRIRDAFTSMVEGLRERLDAANEAARRSQSIFSMLEGALSGRYVSSSIGNTFARREGALGFIRRGDFSDEKLLEEALSVVSEPTEDLFGSFVDYARDFAWTSGTIEEAKKIAQTQLTADEKSVLLLEEQIAQAQTDLDAQLAALDQQYQMMVDQYNALLGIDTSVKGVSQAIATLSAAIEALATAQAAAKAAATAGLGGGGTFSEQYGTGTTYKQWDLAKISGTSELRAAAELTGISTSGKTGLQIAQEIANATQMAIDIDNATRKAQFAMGGFHTGGMRMVGERGPELEATGPARIFSHNQTASMFRDPDLKDAVRSLKEEVAGLRTEQRQIQMDISKYTKRSYDIERKWDVEGLPATRT